MEHRKDTQKNFFSINASIFFKANHTRFEHCIGTSHLAGEFLKGLDERQKSLKITKIDEFCIRIAGLCHDLGHGPFSHLFEEVVEKINGESSWKHEMATLELFDRMYKNEVVNEKYKTTLKQEFESYGIFENDVQFIKDLIYCEKLKDTSLDQSYDERVILFERPCLF